MSRLPSRMLAPASTTSLAVNPDTSCSGASQGSSSTASFSPGKMSATSPSVPSSRRRVQVGGGREAEHADERRLDVFLELRLGGFRGGLHDSIASDVTVRVAELERHLSLLGLSVQALAHDVALAVQALVVGVEEPDEPDRLDLPKSPSTGMSIRARRAPKSAQNLPTAAAKAVSSPLNNSGRSITLYSREVTSFGLGMAGSLGTGADPGASAMMPAPGPGVPARRSAPLGGLGGARLAPWVAAPPTSPAASPRATPLVVRIPTVSQAASRPTYRTTAAQRKKATCVCRASCVVPVTHVPTGNVNDHQVSASPCAPVARAR